MQVIDAQRDMRLAYYGGAPGLLASATAWFVAGLFAVMGGPNSAVLALLIGGMFIHPAAVLLCKALGRPGAHARDNPLGTLALEGTVLLILCLPLAYTVSRYRVEWFFPAMLLVIGGRYLTFATLYGTRLYWACGAALAAAAFLLVKAKAPLASGAFTGAAIEALFAAAVFVVARRRDAALVRADDSSLTAPS